MSEPRAWYAETTVARMTEMLRGELFDRVQFVGHCGQEYVFRAMLDTERVVVRVTADLEYTMEFDKSRGARLPLKARGK